jgi:hypothetical protein
MDLRSAERAAITTVQRIEGVSLVRPMGGSSRAELITASDGRDYVAKWAHGPQARRSLISEVIATSVLRSLGVRVPDIAFVALDTPFIEQYRARCFAMSRKPVPIERGLHFGSRVMEDSTRIAIYDSLPANLLYRVSNIKDFATTLVVDKWLNNQDRRQAVFYRQRVWVVDMIDHGLCCGGNNWKFQDSPLFGLYRDPEAYNGITDWDDLEPTIEKLESNFVEGVIAAAVSQIPDQWLVQDPGRSDLTLLCEQLLNRRSRVRRLLLDIIGGPHQVFRNWGLPKEIDGPACLTKPISTSTDTA